MSKILLVGAGKFGKRFYHYLIDHGHQVTTLSRTEKNWSKNHIRHNLLSNKATKEKTNHFDKIFFILAPNRRDEESYIETYITSISTFILHNTISEDTQCIFMSATSVFGAKQIGIINENTLPSPDNFRGRVLYHAENNIQRLVKNVSIVRASGLYSKQRIKLIDSLLAAENLHNPKWINLIHEDDLCQWLDIASSERWELSIASDGQSFQRKSLLSLCNTNHKKNYRQFRSNYLSKIKLRYPSFKDWLNCQ